MTRRFGVLALWCALFLLLSGCGPAFGQAPHAIGGQLDLRAIPAEPLPLQGEWGFAWQRFVDPGWTRLPTTAVAPVPSSWNDLRADGKPAGENGYGSYVLLVNCPAGERVVVDAIGQRTASRLYVNGNLVASQGVAGTSAENTAAAVHNRVPVTREAACPLRLTLHVANFEHRAGGFVRPLLVGARDAVMRDRESRLIRHAMLLTAYLLTGLVALIFYAVRRRERTPLVYGLFCLGMAVYTDLIGERLLLRLLPAQVPWTPYMAAEYLSWIAAMALFFLTLYGLFPREIRRPVVTGILAALGCAAIAVIMLPPAVYSHFALPGQAIAALVGLYVAAALLHAQRRSPFDARVLLVGMASVVAMMLLDLALIDAPRPDQKFAPIGFAIFLLSPAVVIARRLSHALNAEERSRTLEENARLREDVERMSRHDLKTPLNSILGASRLLRDGGGLDADQAELVGVVQRAGLRMLEMVNLSLGLYRMETGSYEFQPHAVDLQEVVGRVLVDLHGLAEATRVTLYQRGSDRTAVQVRGEELLCYSIVANLVKNAIEATPAGGAVMLDLRRGDPVTLAIHNPSPVPPAVASRFFEKYVTDGKSGGTGLGTYSARLMARAQQGELDMRTGADGTTLTLRLRPLNEAAAPARPAAPAERPIGDWVRDMPARRVLVVDDDEFTRLVTRRFLPTPPFEVETAANGQAAAAAMERRWPHFLLLDMEMPVQDGVATVRWVREQEAHAGRPRCRVVMLSGNDDPASMARALEAGADRFLVKPVAREVLLATLGELDPGDPVDEQHTIARAVDGDGHLIQVEAEWLGYFPEFMRIQRDNVEAMARALAAGNREDLRFLAHRAFGGMATMGLAWAAKESRSIEEQALEAPLAELEGRVAGLREHLARLRFEPA